MIPTETGVGLGINHFDNIVTNVFTSNPYPVPGTPKVFMGECDVLTCSNVLQLQTPRFKQH